MLAGIVAGIVVAGPAEAGSGKAVARGFYATVFGGEDRQNAAAGGFVKKFTRPVRYHLVSTSRVDRRPSARDYLASLSGAVVNLDLLETGRAASADLIIYLTDRADYVATIRATAWEGVATGFLEANACSTVLAARRGGIERAMVYLVADEGFAAFAHCLVEEVAQSLGPANDDPALAGSIFNDRSRVVGLGELDWLILNVLYDARILPGMDARQVGEVLPQVIADTQRRLGGMPPALVRSLP
ncbi:MAG: DUF2927 domain-containing protein [Acuticoccus sp.]